MRNLRPPAGAGDTDGARATAARPAPRRVRGRGAGGLALVARPRDLRARALRVRGAPRGAEGPTPPAVRHARLAPLGEGPAPLGRAARNRPRAQAPAHRPRRHPALSKPSTTLK